MWIMEIDMQKPPFTNKHVISLLADFMKVLMPENDTCFEKGEEYKVDIRFLVSDHEIILGTSSIKRVKNGKGNI